MTDPTAAAAADGTALGVWSTQQSVMKRPRSTSPQPSASVNSSRSRTSSSYQRRSYNTSANTALASASSPDSLDLAVKLKDESQRTDALNELLKLSASHDQNHIMGRNGDKLLQALATIVQQTLHWDASSKNKESSAGEDDRDSTKPLVFSSKSAWKEFPIASQQAWITHVREHLPDVSPEGSQRLHVVLMILRNLSFVAANARCMAYSTSTLNLLVACLYETHTDSSETESTNTTSTGAYGASSSSSHATNNTMTSSNNLALYALHTLLSTSPYLDITGQSLLRDKLFLDPTLRETLMTASHDDPKDVVSLSQLGWGGLGLAKRFDTKEDVLEVVDVEFRRQVTQEYIAHVYALFPALRFVLTHPNSPRPNVMLAMEVLREFLDHHTGGVVLPDGLDTPEPEFPNMSWILRELPQDMLERLVDCLWIPRLGPDAMDYVNPVCNIVSRVSALKLLMGYDATVDTELRDRSLDVLAPWLGLSSTVCASRLTIDPRTKRTRTRLYDGLFPVLSTRVGRNEASMLATQVFRYLATSPDSARGLLYVQERIVELASRDARVAQLVFTHLYVDRDAQHDGGEENMDDSENEEGFEEDDGEEGGDSQNDADME